MMTNPGSRKRFGLLLLLLTSFGHFSVADTKHTAYATVPFQFWVDNARLPAGTYELTHAMSPTLVVFSSDKPIASSEAYMLPVSEQPVKQSDANLIFALHNGQYYLYEIRGRFGTRIVSAQFGFPEPTGAQRVEVPIAYR